MKKQKYYIKRNSVLKIISIHIPKTAGRSFYQVLKWAYGDKIDLPHNRDKYVIDGRFDESSIDFNKTEVLHGHFHFRHIEHLYQKYNPKIIVWLRNPVDRVISNYYYNISINLQKPWKKNADTRKNLTLIKFASRLQHQNAITKFIEEIKTEDIYFIGITERFDTDIKRLGKMLNWSNPIPKITENIGTDYYSNSKVPTQLKDINDKMRKQIRELNLDDVNLYETITAKQ